MIEFFYHLGYYLLFLYLGIWSKFDFTIRRLDEVFVTCLLLTIPYSIMISVMMLLGMNIVFYRF